MGMEQWRAAVGAMANSAAPKPQSPIGPHWKKWLKASDPVAYKGCVVLLVVVGQLVWSGVEQCKEKMQKKMKEGSECVCQSASRGKTRVLGMRARSIAVMVMSFLSQVLIVLRRHILQLHYYSTDSCTTGGNERMAPQVSEEGFRSDGVWTRWFNPVLMILLRPLTQLTHTINRPHIPDKSSRVLSGLTTGVKQQMKCLSVGVCRLLLYVCVCVSVLKRFLQWWASVVYKKCSKETIAGGVVWIMSILFSGSVRTGVRMVTMIVFVNQMLLMIAGDVERNPGPGRRESIHCMLPLINILFSTDHLTKSDLKELLEELHEVRDIWFRLGVLLGVPSSDLRAIQTQCRDLADCLMEMLSHWLAMTPPPPTWQRVVDALNSPPIKKYDIAERISEEHCTEDFGSFIFMHDPWEKNVVHIHMYVMCTAAVAEEQGMQTSTETESRQMSCYAGTYYMCVMSFVCMYVCTYMQCNGCLYSCVCLYVCMYMYIHAM